MKRVVVFTIAFCLGYVSYYFVDRYSVRNLKIDELVEKTEAVEESSSKFVTYVDFDGKSFSSQKVSMKKGDYLAITNLSNTTQMWLAATVSALTTKRGYAEGERLQIILGEPGLFRVGEKVSGAVVEIEVI